MQVRYEKVGRTGKNRFTGEMREPIDRAYYICQTYNRLGKNACTSHKIEARDLDVYKRQPEGSVTYVLDKSRLSNRLVPPYSEERKAAASAYAKEHGFQVVGAEEKIA